jgi:hypothetical protein
MSAIGKTIKYLVADGTYMDATIRGEGKRKDSGRTYYTIEPVEEDGTRCRRRNVAWSSVKWPDEPSVIDS